MKSAGTTRIAIVGAGHVGATFAYALMLSGLASEIVLIDVRTTLAEGEAMDLSHAVPFGHPTRIWAGDYSDCAGAVVTVIAAGVNQKPGETRLELLNNNVAVFREIVPQVVQHNPNGILLVATNPVDLLTYVSLKLSSLPTASVIGSGTTLDTARFRYLLGQHCGVDARSVHAHVIGEHGDSEVPLWSLANIAGMQLADYCAAHDISYGQSDRDELFRGTRDAAYEIIKRKGATYYAVAAGLVRIVESIVRDQHTVLSVSTRVDDYHDISDVCLSLPCVISREGVTRVLRLELSSEEVTALQRSAGVLRAALANVSVAHTH
ncbi:MAG: L-lactate dehydrogenase [Pseudomonadota bacterium]